MLKVLNPSLEEFCTPKKGTKFSACVDLFAREDVVIGAGETVLVPLGVRIDLLDFMKTIVGDEFYTLDHYQNEIGKREVDEFLKSHQLNLHIRSSMSAKHGLIIANGTGIIDLDYLGEIKICIHKPIPHESMFISYQEKEGGEIKTSSVKSIPHVLKENTCLGQTQDKYTIKKGDRIAQISLVEHKTYLLGVESEDIRDGGFGSTDA